MRTSTLRRVQRTRRPRAAAAGLLAAALGMGLATLGTAAPTAPAASTPAKPMQAAWHGTSWSVPIDLSGRASKKAKVTASAPCAIGMCTATTTADAKGKWKVRFDAVLAPNTTTLAVTLASGSQRLTRPFTVAPPKGSKPAAGTVMVIGDSLAVGTASVLPGLLADRSVTTQAAEGRSLAQGMAIFGNTPLDARIQVAVFSLFTNNDPLAVPALKAAVQASMTRLGSKRCAVWFTIRRPAVRKVSYRAANEALIALAATPTYAGRLIIVPWAETVDADHAVLGKDRVHPTVAGYAQRAQLTADAVKACAVSPAR